MGRNTSIKVLPRHCPIYGKYRQQFLSAPLPTRTRLYPPPKLRYCSIFDHPQVSDQRFSKFSKPNEDTSQSDDVISAGEKIRGRFEPFSPSPAYQKGYRLPLCSDVPRLKSYSENTNLNLSRRARVSFRHALDHWRTASWSTVATTCLQHHLVTVFWAQGKDDEKATENYDEA